MLSNTLFVFLACTVPLGDTLPIPSPASGIIVPRATIDPGEYEPTNFTASDGIVYTIHVARQKLQSRAEVITGKAFMSTPKIVQNKCKGSSFEEKTNADSPTSVHRIFFVLTANTHLPHCMRYFQSR
jgi:hypothetical protein